MNRTLLAACCLCLFAWVAPAAFGLDDEHWRKADAAIERGVAYLRSVQNADGSWTPQPGPAVTAMVVQTLLDRPDVSPDDPAVRRAIDYILSFAKEDGGIHAGMLQNYNTAICLSALSRVDSRPDVAEAVAKAQDYLRHLQWKAGMTDPRGEPIDENHPFYGGAGYGKHGRPDMSNTQIMLQGLFDSGVDCNDPAFQRAIVFIARCQGIDANELFREAIVQDGGFIYATSIDADHIGVPQSMANPDMIDEAKLGRPVSGLRGYGSMTYAGFKSYVYAQLDRDDPRVTAAYDWIRRNWTLDRNPGLPDGADKDGHRLDQQGLYYMYMTLGRALRAWGSTTLRLPDGTEVDWANALVDAAVQRQREDGSWVNEADRWMEGDPSLVTAYTLVALQEATR